MDLKLNGKVAMVGGASKGLGFAVARALAQGGAHVSIASRDRAGIDAAAAALQHETGATVIATAADLSKASAIDAWHAATIARFDGVDLVFANTGGPARWTRTRFRRCRVASGIRVAGDERRACDSSRRAVDASPRWRRHRRRDGPRR